MDGKYLEYGEDDGYDESKPCPAMNVLSAR
jgi:hypothetical protein